MSTNAKRDADAGADTLTPLDIQVCSKDGRLLSEHTLTRHGHVVGTLVAV